MAIKAEVATGLLTATIALGASLGWKIEQDMEKERRLTRIETNQVYMLEILERLVEGVHEQGS